MLGQREGKWPQEDQNEVQEQAQSKDPKCPLAFSINGPEPGTQQALNITREGCVTFGKRSRCAETATESATDDHAESN